MPRIQVGNQETAGLGNELAARARMTRGALGAPAPDLPDKPAAAAAGIDVKDMVKPLGQSMPVYDKGGKVHAGRARSGITSLLQVVTKAEHNKNTKMKPLLDKGGKVNVNDGKHQVAILKDGERVLTEKQNKEYEKSEDFDKENPAENAMEVKIYDKGGKVAATPYDLVSPKKAPKVIHHHEYSKTHNGKHVVIHKHHDPSHKDETHMFDKFSDAAEHMNANPPQPEPEAPQAAPAVGGAPAAGGAPAVAAPAM